MENRRFVGTLIAIFLIAVPGWGVIDTLNDKCATLSETKCLFLWILTFISIGGAILLIETFISYQKARGKWQTVELKDKEPTLTSSQVWFRSIARVVLASVLLGLPVIVQGAFVVTVFGFIVGIGFDFLIRGIMNWLPPPLVEEKNGATEQNTIE